MDCMYYNNNYYCKHLNNNNRVSCILCCCCCCCCCVSELGFLLDEYVVIINSITTVAVPVYTTLYCNVYCILCVMCKKY